MISSTNRKRAYQPRGGDMKKRYLGLVVLLAMSACKSSHQTPASPVELKHFSLDSLESVGAHWSQLRPENIEGWKGFSADRCPPATDRPFIRGERRQHRKCDPALPGEFAVTKPRRKGLSGNVAAPPWQWRVFFSRARPPHNRNHELDDLYNSFFPPGRTKARPDPAQPSSGGKRTSVDR